MKRCPECNSLFPDAEHFCEVDGTPLVTLERHQSPSRWILIRTCYSARCFRQAGANAVHENRHTIIDFLSLAHYRHTKRAAQFLGARKCLILFGWEAGTRTPIARSRVWSPTIGRPPSKEFRIYVSTLRLSTTPHSCQSSQS